MFTALLLTWSIQAGGPPAARDTTGPAARSATVPVVVEPGRPAWVEHRARSEGLLRVWVESGDFDPLLAAETVDGQLLAEDDDEGGRPVPLLELRMTPGTLVRLRVSAKSGGGEARVVTVDLPEDETAREQARRAHEQFEAARAGLSTAQMQSARETLMQLATELAANPVLPTSDALQLVLADACEFLYLSGEHGAALTATEHLLAVQEGAFPPDSRRRMRGIVTRAAALNHLGRSAEAIEPLRSAVEVLERTRPATDRSLYAARGALGNAFYFGGQLQAATEQWEVALRGFETIMPADSIDLAVLRANLAVALYYMGDLERARVLVERARSDVATLVRGSPIDIQLRSSLSAIVSEQGDLQAGRILAEETVAAARATHDAGHAAVALAELNLALARARDLDFDGGRELLASVVANPPEGISPDHPLWLQARANLAAIDVRRGDLAGGEARLADLQREVDAALPAGHALSRMVLANRVHALRGLGRTDEAAELELEVLRQTQAVLPPDHPQRLRVELDCAVTASQRGDARAARDTADATARTLRELLVARASFLSAREAQAIARGLAPLVDTTLELLLDERVSAVRPGAAREAFELVETARGIGVAALRWLRAATAGGADARAQRDAARAASLDLARTLRAGTGAEAVRVAVEARDAAERGLSEALARTGPVPRSISAVDLAGRLAGDEIAVSWWIRERAAPEGALELVLCAFLVRHGADVEVVDLARLSDVEAACTAWRTLLEKSPYDASAARAAGERVRALAIDPLRQRAPKARRWIAAPDGPLLSLPLDALPDGDRLLGESMRLLVVWSFDVAAASKPGAARLVALGDPDFGAPPAGASAPWPALGGTAREVEAVADLLRAARPKDAEVCTLRGPQATPQALLSAAGSARWLHVATHGSFDVDDAPDNLLTSVASDDGSGSFERRVRALVPLVRCELALAGANADPRATVTAEDLGTLDLTGCELAVLSACDTGRGEIVAGQGVASFQRALTAAGARAVVTSLWRVPDEAARELMTHFYRGLWAEQLRPDEALWRAKMSLRDRRAPPRDWAGWVLASTFGTP